jgi:hypothetical protein
MYVIATLVGFGTYLWFSPFVMWVAVFTLMPAVSAVLIYGYLRRFSFSREASLHESLVLTGVWMLLSFCLDAVTYVLIVPHLSHSRPNWTFFRDQSPWIWLSYLVLILSALAAQRLYRRNTNATDLGRTGCKGTRELRTGVRSGRP